MDDDEIPFQSPACSRKIFSFITILVSIAIGYRTLMLHSEIWNLDKLVTIFIKRIGSEPIFKGFQHHLNLLELLFCFFKIIRQYIEVHVKNSFCPMQGVSKVNIISNVHIYAVIVNWILYQPFERICSVFVCDDSPQASV